MITELNDTQLLTRICGGDLMAMEAKYHLSCMVKLRNRHRSLIRKQSQVPDEIDSKMNESRAFVELTRYIEEAVTSGTHLFKLSEIHSFHVTRLEELNINKQVNKTRLKDRLLEKFSEAQEQSYGKNSVFVFKEDMKNIVHDAVKTRNFSEDALILSKAAMIVRKDILSHKGFTFTGSFSAQCQVLERLFP
ncbi:hypothetical protein Pcinc_010676 [Petrolisthes cinctipes]|uniref:Uncharacterized protein n=1 Tax=Petrolisthes cinctipes TaxID=88211 RepID=A0AAE1KTB3_PETCI|nr:hypothetical protein Pcinc_010676 [Petrolisthes cinctipes]